MAGDWIKVEHATVEKPEILRAAEMLGISRDAAIGLFVRYFVWLDRNLSGKCPDRVRNVSAKSMDDVLQCPGFAACLESVGWAKFDGDTWSLVIVNSIRHNGNTAKNRALDAARKREKRRDSVRKMSGSKPDVFGTREEKRREERTTTTSAPNAIAFDAAAGWTGITDADRELWRKAFPAIEIEPQLMAAAAWAKANPKNRKANWRRFITGWLSRSQERAPGRGSATPERKLAL